MTAILQPVLAGVDPIASTWPWVLQNYVFPSRHTPSEVTVSRFGAAVCSARFVGFVTDFSAPARDCASVRRRPRSDNSRHSGHIAAVAPKQ